MSLYVLLGQGELIHELPRYVKVLNKDYSDASVLSGKGKKILKQRVFRRLFPVSYTHLDVYKRQVETFMHPDEDMERNMVSIEEALAVTDKGNLRTLMMNVIPVSYTHLADPGGDQESGCSGIWRPAFISQHWRCDVQWGRD